MTKAKESDIWTAKHVKSLAPDAASIPAAQKVLKKGGFGTVEPTADGRGWWVVCRGITDTYQVSARLQAGGDEFDCECTCPSYKNPCKHALALLLYLVDHPELRTVADAATVAAGDFEALLRAVFAHPADDTVRLVFADFLQENGEGDRAALVRLQCEQARLKPTAKRWRELAAELKPLVAKVKTRIEPLPDGIDYLLHRGFLQLEGDFGYLGDAGSLPARFTSLFREGWVASVAMNFWPLDGLGVGGALPLLAQAGELDVSTYPLHADGLVALVADTADARATGRLSRVVVHRANQKAFDQLIKVEQGGSASLGGRLGAERRHGGLNPRTFDLLLRTGQLSGARAMTLGGVLLGDDQLRALIDTADLSDLRELWLSGWALTRAGVAALANGPALARLTELNLDATPLGAATGAVRELAANSGLRNVETLRLIDCAIGDGDARTLAKSPCFPKLKRLELSQNHDLTAAGVAALLASKHFPHLARLDWDDTRLPDRAFLPLLLAAPDRPELAFRVRDVMMRRRILKNERIVEIENPRGEFENAFDDMTSAKGGERVTQLVARSLDLGATEMADLAAGFEPETLWSLNLTDNPLRNDGAAALTTAFATFGLRVLVLAGCRIQSAGVAALVGSDLFGGLHTLDLSRNNLGKAGVAALLKADAPAALKRLVLTYCRLTGDDEKQLKAKYGSRVSL